MATTLARIEFRRRTAAQWTSGNEVLLASEPGVETDTGKWKIGDGTTAWTSLPYQPSAADVAAKAPLASPTFTGSVSGITAAMVGADASGAASTAQAAAVAASQGAWNVTAKTAAYTAAVWDYVVADTTGGTFAVTAPTPTAGKQFGVKWKAGTVAPTLAGTFNSTPAISVLDQAMEFISDGSTWYRTVRPALAQLPDYPTVTDTRYAQVSQVGAGLVSGLWYTPPAVQVGTGIPVEASLRAMPLIVGRTCTLNSLAINVTSAGSTGAVIRLGIYADDGNGNPGTLLVDAGTVDGTVVTTPTLTISLAVTAGNRIWLASAVQGAATTRPTVSEAVNITGAMAIGDSSAFVTLSNGLNCATTSGVTGALPTTATWTHSTLAWRVAVKAA